MLGVRDVGGQIDIMPNSATQQPPLTQQERLEQVGQKIVASMAGIDEWLAAFESVSKSLSSAEAAPVAEQEREAPVEARLELQLNEQVEAHLERRPVDLEANQVSEQQAVMSASAPENSNEAAEEVGIDHDEREAAWDGEDASPPQQTARNNRTVSFSDSVTEWPAGRNINLKDVKKVRPNNPQAAVNNPQAPVDCLIGVAIFLLFCTAIYGTLAGIAHFKPGSDLVRMISGGSVAFGEAHAQLGFYGVVAIFAFLAIACAVKVAARDEK